MASLTKVSLLGICFLVITSGCPSGWTTTNHGCYKHLPTPGNWSEAWTECEIANRFSTLPIFKDWIDIEEFKAALGDMSIAATTDAWIGYNYNTVSSVWVARDVGDTRCNATSEMLPWAVGEPTGGKFAHIIPDTETVAADRNYAIHDVICQIPMFKICMNCPTGWTLTSHACYKILPTVEPFSNHGHACIAANPHTTFASWRDNVDYLEFRNIAQALVMGASLGGNSEITARLRGAFSAGDTISDWRSGDKDATSCRTNWTSVMGDNITHQGIIPNAAEKFPALRMYKPYSSLSTSSPDMLMWYETVDSGYPLCQIRFNRNCVGKI